MLAQGLIRLVAGLGLLVQPGAALDKAAPPAEAAEVAASTRQPSALAAPAVCGVVTVTASAPAAQAEQVAPGLCRPD